jgi:hypothetical protein
MNMTLTAQGQNPNEGAKEVPFIEEPAEASLQRINVFEPTQDIIVRQGSARLLSYWRDAQRLLIRLAIAAIVLAMGLRYFGFKHILDYRFAFGIAAAVIVILAVAARAHFFGKSRTFRKLMTASVSGNWSDVLRLSRELEQRLPKFEVARYQALAKAGAGDLNTAIAIIDSFKIDSSVSPTQFWGARAALYCLEERHPAEALSCYEHLLKRQPDNPEAMLEAALKFVYFDYEIAKAEQILTRLKTMTIPAAQHYNFAWLEGAVALKKGRHAEAVGHLQYALHIGHERLTRTPLGEPIIAVIEGYLVLALTGIDQKREAALLAKQHEKVLLAAGYHRLHQKIRLALQSVV